MFGIREVSPSPEVDVHLPDGRVLRGPRGASLGAFLKPFEASFPAPVMGAVMNGELRELTASVTLEAQVEPVTLADEDGARIYRRSLVFLLEVAFDRLFPEAKLTVEHSVFVGGYFCRVEKRPPLDATELARLEAEMHRLVNADLPIHRQEVPLAEALRYFRTRGEQDKVALLRYRTKPYLTLYELQGYRDYHYGYMVPSTGYLRWFGLMPANGGFILRFPERREPTRLPPPRGATKLLEMFTQYGDWLRRLGILYVGALNDAIQAERVRQIILVAEALHQQQLANIARIIADHRRDLRVVLIAGPSSAGKTTFARRLAVQLLTHGITPFALEVDNYFVDRELTPRDEHGQYDFEHIDAVQRERLVHDLKRLIAGERVRLPRYNFVAGRSEEGPEVQLKPGQMIILEGIHGLNPDLLPGFPQEQAFRIYVSAFTQLNLDRHNRVSTTDTRLLRRIVRDARERGYPARHTIAHWDMVRRGERRWIFPFQEQADVMFNSALVYELAVLKPFAEPLLLQVPPHTRERIEAKRLLSLLEWFLPVDAEGVPDNSILREFIGGSILRDFTVWDPRGAHVDNDPET
ncbi:MAG: nucleoside kinase [Chloroflexi bacterium]|nr:nucleoside kinase [Chloroflexota bacterium]